MVVPINRVSQRCEADLPRAGVHLFVGVNAVGKSTLTDRLAASSPSIVAVHASTELRGLFGNVTRQELERISPQEKLGSMVTHFTALFERHLDDGKTVALDTHLLIPIRSGDTVVYENIWSDAYVPYIKDAVLITADALDIQGWRIADEIRQGRVRDLSLANIETDQDLNAREFNRLVAVGALPLGSAVIKNRNGDPDFLYDIAMTRVMDSSGMDRAA